MTGLPRTVAAAVLISLLLLFAAAAPARADEESVRHLDVTFAIQADGSVDVRYELQWRFADVGQRGITFGIATREPWDADPSQDVVYEIDDIRVSSPSGAPVDVEQTTRGSGSNEDVMLRIGDPDTTLDTQDATYVIEYTLRGALRTFDGRPEFYWDVTSYDYPPIQRFTATVTAPEGVTEARCLMGSSTCSATTAGGEAQYSASAVGGVVSVVAALPAGSVAGAEPVLEPRRETGRGGSERGSGWGPMSAIGIALGIPALITAIGLALRPRDERYTDAPPGAIGSATTRGRRPKPPVRFEPPDVELFGAGALRGRAYHPAHLAATLVDLAARGALRVGSSPLTVQQVGPVTGLAGFEEQLVGAAPREPRPLTASEAEQLRLIVQTQSELFARRSGTLRRKGFTALTAGLLLLCLAVLAAAAYQYFQGASLWTVGGLGFAGLGGLVVVPMLPNQPLTARGSALLDQVEGFEQYLATAEAHQLNFEAEHDIFRRYLPWAVLYGLTDRWTRVCGELASQGRIAMDTSFLLGPASAATLPGTLSGFPTELAALSTPASASGGSGGSSGFSSSSSGGGGGGGTSAGSW